MFADIDATFNCWSTAMRPMMRRAPRMIDKLVNDHLDMVVGFRVDQSAAAYRPVTARQ